MLIQFQKTSPNQNRSSGVHIQKHIPFGCKLCGCRQFQYRYWYANARRSKRRSDCRQSGFRIHWQKRYLARNSYAEELLPEGRQVVCNHHNISCYTLLNVFPDKVDTGIMHSVELLHLQQLSIELDLTEVIGSVSKSVSGQAPSDSSDMQI